MALIECPECHKPISTLAQSCPSCGYVLPATSTDPATPLLEVRRSWWGCLWLLCFAWLVIPLVIALVRRNSLRMKIYPNRVSLERGLVNKEYRELFIRDIRSIDVDQSFFQRMLGIGDVTISTAATVDADEIVTGVSDPLHIKELLIARREQEEPR
jgi:uncharacterized membrane protein YdbT with pleckstrin-like domain